MRFFIFVVGVMLGWDWAHHTVAVECKKLGKFYVGKEVFECTKIEDKHDAGKSAKQPPTGVINHES